MTQTKQYLPLLRASLFCLVAFMPLQGFALDFNEYKIQAASPPALKVLSETVTHPATFNQNRKKVLLLAQAVEPEAEEAADTESAPQPIIIENGKYGPVKLGDNLYQIARAAIPKNSKINLPDAMQAIFETNPHAFLETLEQIKLGAYLTIPNFSNDAPATEADKTSTAKTNNDQPVGDQPITDQPTSSVLDSIALPAYEDNSKAKGGIAPFIEEPSPQAASAEEAAPEVATAEQEPAAPSTEEKPPKETQATIPESIAFPESSGIAAPSESDLANDQQSTSNAINTPIGESINDIQVQAFEDRQTLNDSPNPDETITTNKLPQHQPSQEGLSNELVDVRNQLAQARKELDHLISDRESLGKGQSTLGRMGASITKNTIQQWIPWVLVALMLPALLFLLLRRRMTDSPIQEEPYHKIEPPAETSENTVNEFESPTLTGQALIEKEGDTIEIMTSPVFGVQEDETAPQQSDDLELSSDDTHQSLHPGLLSTGSPQTVEGEEDRIKEADASLDTSQEAEIYLAYEQYSLAERTIDELLEAEPDNDRNLLLRLKLYAKTDRISELHSLSAELLQKHPDEDSDTHKQVQDICRKALKQHSTKATTQLPAGEIATDTATQHPNDRADGEIIEEKEAEEVDPIAKNLDELYSDDIADYLSDDSLSNLDGLSADTMSIEYEDFAHALLDDNAPLEDLTEQEIDAISAEMELMDEPDQVILESNSYSEVQNLSDADPHYATVVEDATVELSPQEQDSGQPATNLDIAFGEEDLTLQDPPTEDDVKEQTDLSGRKPL